MKNLIISGIFACLLGFAGISKAQVFQCANPIFTHGPSLGFMELSPSNPHPFSVSAGAGYSATLGLCQFVLDGKSWDLLDIGALALGSVTSPSGSPVGAFQVGPELGTFNNIVGLAALFTPYAANGDGFLQGGRPGTAFGLILTIPLSFGAPSSPPVGVGSSSAASYFPRGGTLNF
jgi:hypothetical protein